MTALLFPLDKHQELQYAKQLRHALPPIGVAMDFATTISTTPSVVGTVVIAAQKLVRTALLIVV